MAMVVVIVQSLVVFCGRHIEMQNTFHSDGVHCKGEGINHSEGINHILRN